MNAPHDPLWYKDAVIYELHVKAFFDANGDGIGDFAGLLQRLDHVRDLGVNTLWLLPFYPSPLRDDGYDVADFLGVHPAYGTVDELREVVAQAHARGLRVITELVVNHTSDQHPWFQAARRAPRGSAERDFYVWTDDPTQYAGTRIIFTDTETSNWCWDPVAGQHYWHRFFSHQPDLNFDNPAVREAVFGVMEFWLALGVDGFRLDAIPYLVEREGTSNENLRETHAVIKELRRRLDARYSGKLLLAEANMWPEDVREYFGDGDECHMAYHFPLMPRMYMAIAQEDRHPVVEILQQTPDIPAACQWAIFLRNHDELTLEMVTSKERDYLYTTYAADPRARINLGIRRRLAPLLDNDPARITLMNSLLLSMPGSPVLYYGDEIGMGDNIFLGDRDGVRTPMQWSSDRNGGFSRADPQRLYLPAIQDPVYGFEAVNVEAQSRDAASLLHWMRRMLAVRRTSQVFGRGRITLLHPGNRKVLAYIRELDAADGHPGEAVLCVANLGRSAQPVALDLARFKGRVPVEMAGQTAFAPVTDAPWPLTLPGHGFFWFRLATDVAPPAWLAQPVPVEDLPVLVLFDGWNSLFRDKVVPWRIGLASRLQAQLQAEVLPRWLARQPWAAAQGVAALPGTLQIAEHAVLQQGGREWLLALAGPDAAHAATVAADGGAPAAPRWFVPLALAWEDEDEARHRQLAPAALAKVRMQARVGVLADASADAAFCQALVQAVGDGRVLSGVHGHIRCVPTPVFAAVAGGASGAAREDAAQPHGPVHGAPAGRHSVLRVGERLLLKLLRRVLPGPNAELELGRFLHEVAGHAHSPALAGSVEWVAADGTATTLALLQAWVPNQGNLWTLAVDQLARQLDRVLGAVPSAPADAPAAVAEGLADGARRLGERVAGLHAALASHRRRPAFDRQPVEAADLQAWAQRVQAAAQATLAGRSLPQPAPDLLGAALRLAERAAALAPAGSKQRIHGALRLQEVLLVQDDLVLVDFGDDDAVSAAERRALHSPLRDVAGLLQSFEQARQAALWQAVPSGVEPERRAALAQHWSETLRTAFLQAYADAAVAAGLWPDAATFGRQAPLLALFELEQALAGVHAPGSTPAAALAHLHTLLARQGPI